MCRPAGLPPSTPRSASWCTGAGGLTIRYRTGRGAAVRRLQRAAAASWNGPASTRTPSPRCATWWSGCAASPATRVVELDYGGAARLFSEGELATDETAEEVAASLRALQRGDFEAAAEHYGRVAARWAHAQSLTFAS